MALEVLLNFFGLAFADKRAGVGMIHFLDKALDCRGTGGECQKFKFIKVFCGCCLGDSLMDDTHDDRGLRSCQI
jgi:hypothetical protein